MGRRQAPVVGCRCWRWAGHSAPLADSPDDRCCAAVSSWRGAQWRKTLDAALRRATDPERQRLSRACHQLGRRRWDGPAPAARGSGLELPTPRARRRPEREAASRLSQATTQPESCDVCKSQPSSTYSGCRKILCGFAVPASLCHLVKSSCSDTRSASGKDHAGRAGQKNEAAQIHRLQAGRLRPKSTQVWPTLGQLSLSELLPNWPNSDQMRPAPA